MSLIRLGDYRDNPGTVGNPDGGFGAVLMGLVMVILYARWRRTREPVVLPPKERELVRTVPLPEKKLIKELPKRELVRSLTPEEKGEILAKLGPKPGEVQYHKVNGWEQVK